MVIKGIYNAQDISPSTSLGLFIVIAHIGIPFPCPVTLGSPFPSVASPTKPFPECHKQSSSSLSIYSLEVITHLYSITHFGFLLLFLLSYLIIPIKVVVWLFNLD